MTPEQTVLYNTCAERADEIVSIAQAYIRDGVPINTAFRNCIASMLYQDARDRSTQLAQIPTLYAGLTTLFIELDRAIAERNIDHVAFVMQQIHNGTNPK